MVGRISGVSDADLRRLIRSGSNLFLTLDGFEAISVGKIYESNLEVLSDDHVIWFEIKMSHLTLVVKDIHTEKNLLE